MKNMKKLASLLLVLVMVFALAAPALATEVTIKLPAKGDGTPANTTETYRAYKIFDADVAGENQNQDITDPTGKGSTFDHVAYSISDNSPFYSTIRGFEGITLTELRETDGVKTYNVQVTDEFSAAALATALQALVNTPDFAGEPEETKTATFEAAAKMNLGEGYYLIVGSLGSNAILDTVGEGAVAITTKNNLPTIEKTTPVVEGKKIGDTVDYTITVHAKPGATNYVVHDTMGTGLTFNKDVTIAGLEKDTDYTVVDEGLGDSCTFHVIFTKAYLDTIKADTNIVITYSATINADATLDVDTTTNKAHLSYGDNAHTEDTEEPKAETPLYSFDLVKTTSNNNADEAYKLLAGAEFELQDKDGNVIPLVAVDENTYRPAILDGIEADPVNSRVDSIITNATSKITFTGFGKGTYYLEELVAPDGYNKLDTPAEVKIVDGNLTANISHVDAQGEGENAVPAYEKYDGGDGIHVVNYTGAELPSTGGIGTTLFYIVGGLLIVGAAVLLITKKRVNGEQ